jgi:hypothetical protein
MMRMGQQNGQHKNGQSEAAKAYWASVKRCVAWPDGAGRIVHENGAIEHIGSDGRRFAISKVRLAVFPAVTSATGLARAA